MALDPLLNAFNQTYFQIAKPRELSKQPRLERLHPEAYLKESSAELQIPIPEENPVEVLSDYLKDLVPVPTSIT